VRVNIIELLAELTDDLREIDEIVSKKAIEIKEENSKHKKENDDLILKRFVSHRMTILIFASSFLSI
jgi:uncharacterized membrane protein (DUF106 family)